MKDREVKAEHCFRIMNRTCKLQGKLVRIKTYGKNKRINTRVKLWSPSADMTKQGEVEPTSHSGSCISPHPRICGRR